MTTTATPGATKPENPYASAYKNFLEQTKNHVLTVERHDDLNRQLYVGEPGTGIWHWRVTTWPGYLATYGDVADGYMFTRISDMLQFFDRGGHHGYYSDGAPSIDFRYWAEKLSGGRSHDVKKFDSDKFIRELTEHLEEHDELGLEAQVEYERALTLLRKMYELGGKSEEVLTERLEAHWATSEALERPGGQSFSIHRRDDPHYLAELAKGELWDGVDLSEEQLDLLINDFGWDALSDMTVPRMSPSERRAELISTARTYSESEHEAREWLRDDDDARDAFGDDAYWEWDFREYDIHFLFTCYAIDLTVQLFRKYEAEIAAAAAANVPDNPVDRIQVNDALTALFAGFGIQDDPEREGWDEYLNDLTHTVADKIDGLRAHAEQNAA